MRSFFVSPRLPNALIGQMILHTTGAALLCIAIGNSLYSLVLWVGAWPIIAALVAIGFCGGMMNWLLAEWVGFDSQTAFRAGLGIDLIVIAELLHSGKGIQVQFLPMWPFLVIGLWLFLRSYSEGPRAGWKAPST